MLHQEWHDASITTLFKTKSNFRRERRLCNSVYNGRSVFMKAKKLNASTVKDVWRRLPTAEKVYWGEVARRMNVETSVLRIR